MILHERAIYTLKHIIMHYPECVAIRMAHFLLLSPGGCVARGCASSAERVVSALVCFWGALALLQVPNSPPVQ